MSLRLAAVNVTARGMPWPSLITWCFEPGLLRSTGEGPVFAPPLLPAHASYPPPRGTSRAARRPGARPRAPGATVPRPPPHSSREAAASTSSPTHTPSLEADPPTGYPSSARTRSPSRPAGPPDAYAPGSGTDAPHEEAAARPAPTTHH